jgi:hypothetical protein
MERITNPVGFHFQWYRSLSPIESLTVVSHRRRLGFRLRWLSPWQIPRATWPASAVMVIA